MANSTGAVITGSHFCSRAFSEKRAREGKINTALVVTTFVCLGSLIATITLFVIPLISPIVLILICSIFIAVALGNIPLLVVSLYDHYSPDYYRARIDGSIKKIISDSQKEIKDQPQKNDHLLDSKFLNSIRALERCKHPDGKFTSSTEGVVLKFDHESNWTLAHIFLTADALAQKIDGIRNRLKEFTNVKSIRKIESVLNQMQAAGELLQKINKNNPPLEDAGVIFNIINKVRSEKSEADHQMIKDQHKTIDKIFACSKFLLAKALIK